MRIIGPTISATRSSAISSPRSWSHSTTVRPTFLTAVVTVANRFPVLALTYVARTGTFWFSRLFRIMESLEKHSGVSCSYNLAHKAQQFLPFAQMPHHHDWHHEGHKGCNYTFSSIGGFWDCIFGTRKSGRYEDNTCATPRDKARLGPSLGRLPRWFHPLLPVLGMGCAVAAKLGGR